MVYLNAHLYTNSPGTLVLCEVYRTTGSVPASGAAPGPNDAPIIVLGGIDTVGNALGESGLYLSAAELDGKNVAINTTYNYYLTLSTGLGAQAGVANLGVGGYFTLAVLLTAGGGGGVSPTPPTISSISPTTGAATGGTPVSITGSGFTGTTAVTFNGTAAISFSVVSDTAISAISPAGTGTVHVNVTTPTGTADGVQFTYSTAANPPFISGISPNSGPPAGGTSVTVIGSSFTGATAVHFGSVLAASFSVVSDTHIVTTSPAGTGMVSIKVTTPAGSTDGFQFT